MSDGLLGLGTRRWLSAVLVVSSSTLIPAAASAASCGGVSYPETKQVIGKKLLLNGLGIREATIFNVDVYVAALYLVAKSSNGGEIARAEQVKQMVLTLVRDVEADEMNEAIEKGFKRNAGDRMASLRARIDQFRKLIPNLKKGDVIAFTYVPKKGLSVEVNGTVRGRVEGADFSTVFFNIWLGHSPPNAGLKRGLLGGKCE